MGRLAVAVWLAILPLVVVDAWLGVRDRAHWDPAPHIDAAKAYRAEIIRDRWGVPHVIGATDADAAFGLAVAHAQDDIATIESVIPVYRGRAARYRGADAAALDYLVQWMDAPDAVRAGWAGLDPRTRALVDGYAAGLNWYAATHPGEVDERIWPVTAQDIVVGFSIQHLFFYGFQRTLTNIPIGSNAMAVAPSRSSDGATRVLGNSHQPMTGALAWYEVQVQSDEGWVMHGGLFPGSPVITIGANPGLAWGVTVNQPDLVDTYRISVHPEDPGRYRMDGKWLDFTTRTAQIPVKLWGNLYWTVEREIIETLHGPALRTDDGVVALRFAGHREIRQVEQWHRMNLARTWEAWAAAMDLNAIASFNFVYGDSSGRIGLVHNSRSPYRQPGLDWRGEVPGDRSELIWERVQGFRQNPQVWDPASGFVFSANQTPWQVSAPGDNPDPAAHAPEFGFPKRMTNRAHRGLDLLLADAAISRADFEAIKYDHHYSPRSRGYRWLAGVQDLAFDDPLLTEAQAVLARWNRGFATDNRQARLAVCLLGREWQAEQRRDPAPDVAQVLRECVDELLAHHGGLEVPWGQVNRLQVGAVDLPVNGGPDTLRAIYSVDDDGDGVLTAVGGDGLTIFTEWAADGSQLLRSIHQFGAATGRPRSPHHTDQAPLFAAEQLRTLTFDRDRLRARAVRIDHVPR